MKVTKKVILLLSLIFGITCCAEQKANSQDVKHCKPDDKGLGLVLCYQESPFDSPQVIAAREFAECINSIVEEDQVIHKLFAMKKKFINNNSKEFLELRKRHKELAKKIEKSCWANPE